MKTLAITIAAMLTISVNLYSQKNEQTFVIKSEKNAGMNYLLIKDFLSETFKDSVSYQYFKMEEGTIKCQLIRDNNFGSVRPFSKQTLVFQVSDSAINVTVKDAVLSLKNNPFSEDAKWVSVKDSKSWMAKGIYSTDKKMMRRLAKYVNTKSI